MWTDEDREYALQWQELEREVCPGCGHPTAESFDPKHANHWDTKVLRCFACEARELRQAAIAEDDKGGTEGLYVMPVRDHTRWGDTRG